MPALGGCGGHHARPVLPRPPATSAAFPPPPTPKRLALGLDENNANLLASIPSTTPSPAFAPWRQAVAALAPRYLRFVVDWARVQPSPAVPPRWDAPADGCLRGIEPCASYAGLHADLLAVASQQRAGVAVEPVVTISGAPAWAARAPGGCERPGTTSFSRSMNAAGQAGYRRLILSLLAEARQDGVALPYWSPWNEPNHPMFLSPQRARCDAGSPSLAPAVYAQMARTMAATLAAEGGPHQLLLGELAGYTVASPTRTSIGEFVSALPGDALCRGSIWTVHDYFGPSSTSAPQADPVDALERALQRRGGCAAGAHIWVTETGAGEPRPGGPRPGPAAERAACRALAAALSRWQADPRVDAAFQYTFRDDTAFPVGLVDAGLSRPYPTYSLLRAWADRPRDGTPPPVPAQCRGAAPQSRRSQ